MISFHTFIQAIQNGRAVFLADFTVKLQGLVPLKKYNNYQSI